MINQTVWLRMECPQKGENGLLFFTTANPGNGIFFFLHGYRLFEEYRYNKCINYIQRVQQSE